MIMAIETKYNGHLFRSRLEARWAVFFDVLGVRYLYEPERFLVTNTHGHNIGTYLPDFHLPDYGTWVEVKGSLGDCSDEYLEMIANAVDWGGCLPGMTDSICTSRGLLWLGPIPETHWIAVGIPRHVILQHGKGGWAGDAGFFPDGLHTNSGSEGYFDSSCGGTYSAKIIRAELQKVYTAPRYVFPEPAHYRLIEAYDAARTARFEHGQTPKFGI